MLNNAIWSIQRSNDYTQQKILQQNRKAIRSHNTISGEDGRDLTKINQQRNRVGCDEVSRRSNCVEIVQKSGTVVARRKERARQFCEVGCSNVKLEQPLALSFSLSLSVLWKGLRRRSSKGQTGAGRGRVLERVCEEGCRGIVAFNFSSRNLTQVTSAMKPGQGCMVGFASVKRVPLREGLY